MSFIQGETLEEYLNKASGGKLAVEEVLQIGIQLCTVLNYLHSQQPPIIFRDLKPSNIMRTMDGHLYLIDFGIARHFKPGQAKDTAAYGSMGYASPEQYGKAQTTPRSDIYSLGAVLYQLLSGHDPSTTPFRFPPLQSQVPTVPTELAAIITQMLQLDENDRPTSVLVVKQKLQSVAASSGGTSHTPPTVPGGKSPIPPTMPVGPTPISPLVSPPASTRVKVFSFGRRQLAFTVIGIVLYVVMFLVAHNYQVPVVVFFILEGVTLVIPLFFGSVSGPWAGLGTAGVGSFVGLLLRFSHFLSRSFVDVALLGLLGFVAGLTLLKTQGRYDDYRNVIFTTVVNCLVSIIYITFTHYYIYSASLYNDYGVFITFLIILILLPILLIIYNMVVKHRSHP